MNQDTTPTSGAADLRTAAQAVVERWDTPLWKDVPATAEYIGRLRAALAAGQATAAPAQPAQQGVAYAALPDENAAFFAWWDSYQLPDYWAARIDLVARDAWNASIASHGQASSQAGEYPALVCDYCGALTPDPWHSSGMLHGKMSKHIHSCDACAARGAARAQDTREPLTDEQIQDLLLCGDPTDEEMRLIRIGWDAARGIKGGQHGDATPQPTQPDPAYSAACHLATVLFKKHFAHLPDFASGQAVWSLCDSTAGVISQIDNMVSGLVQPPSPTAQADNVLEDAARLDYLHSTGSTIEMLPGEVDFYPMRFRVGGLHSAVSPNLREAIDAARKQGGV